MISGIFVFLAYIPTIHQVYVKKDQSDTSIAGWIVWWFTSIISTLYASLVVKDDLFIYTSLGHVIGITIIIYLKANKKS